MPEEIERLIQQKLAVSAAAFPSFGVDPQLLTAFIAERLPDTGDPVSALESLHFDELYLVFACLSGSDRALAELERRYIAEAAAALRRLGLGQSAQEEAIQRAREKLLTGGPDTKPKLAQYSGQGSLAGWIRVVVVRTALNEQRVERRHAPREDDDLLVSRVAADSGDPELEVIRARYAEALSNAVAAAFRRLTSEQRNLLRLYVIDRLTLAELGRMHGVDASTVSRWLARIRGNLLDDARNHLLERYAMRPSECESVMRAARSGLNVTVERLLATEPPDTADD